MRFFRNPKRVQSSFARAWYVALSCGCVAATLLWIAGCGTPGAPQPPSLLLPETVTDLTAVRAGQSVNLHWTMPKKTIDHLLIKEGVPFSICVREGSNACQPSGAASAQPGQDFDFLATLPAPLQQGEPRPISWFVELKSPKGRSAGLSNPAVVLAGKAPGAIVGLSAQARADGVAILWNPSQPPEDRTFVRLHRKLLTPPAPPRPTEKDVGPLKPSTEPIFRDLMVDPPAPGQSPAPSSGAVDTSAHFGETYQYTAQRLVRASFAGRDLELAGEVSAPIQIDVIDTFPPAIPHGLVAVYVPEDKTLDLSWEPDTEQDLAGYIVYRADADADPVTWTRVSPAPPLSGTAYRDRTVEPGKRYRYAVTAIDQTGHESHRSMEAQESVPNP